MKGKTKGRYDYISLYVCTKFPKIKRIKTLFLKMSMTFEVFVYKIGQMLNNNYRFVGK